MIYRGDNYHLCLECKRVLIFGDIVTQGKWGYYCQTCSERESGLMIRWGFSMKPKCTNCDHYFWYGEMVFLNKDGRHICQKCSEREYMKNIKITVEVNGKQVPLETISTETFEAIKTLEKPKEIPVARVGAWNSDGRQRRLFLKITKSIMQGINGIDHSDDNIILVIDPEDGIVATQWSEKNDERQIDNYRNVRPL